MRRWRGVRILIVSHHQHQRQLFHGRLVQRLVKCARGGRPLAYARSSHCAGYLLEPPRHQHPVYHRDHGPQVTDHRQITLTGPSPVHIPVPAPHGPQGGPHVRPQGVQDRFAKSKSAGGIANQRRKNIRFLQGKTNRHAQGFLPAAKKNPAMNFSGAVKRS